MTVITDAGNELPADFADVAAVQVASLAEAGEVTLGVAGVGVIQCPGLMLLMDVWLLLLNRSLWVGPHGPLLFR